MSTFIFAIAGFVFLALGLVVMFFSLRWLNSDEVAPRLKTYVAEEGQPAKRINPDQVGQSRQVSGSFMSRLILPTIRRMSDFLGRLTPARSMEAVQHQLVVAGNPLGLGAREFYGLRFAFTMVGFLLAFMFLRRGFDRVNIILALLVFALCFLFPVLWLRMTMQRRQGGIQKSLPDALDMLSVCADAGLGFDQSMQRVAEHWDTPMGKEFGRVTAEMEMGLSRRDAMRNMADRLDVSEVSSFVSVILQSEQLGMSITDTLHAQADQMRVERRFRAQEQARTLPVKMLIPLAFLIFPAIMAVVLGPAVPQILGMFNNF
jgi:tight adherence protein C